jgi:hypothetical protein
MLHGGDDLVMSPLSEGAELAEPVADFAVVDVNPSSDRFDQMVSPRDYLQMVSGWYFGNGT